MKTYIHIGYPKNASTSLQTDFFPNIEGAYYLGCQYGKGAPFVSKDIQEALYSIAMSDSIDFSYKNVEEKIRHTIQDIDSRFDKMIISWEAFSNNVADRGVIAERLNKLFPDANILIIIRNQMDSLQSMYAFLVQQLGKNINLSYGRPSVTSFEKWISEQEDFFYRSYMPTLKYYEFISEYWKLFGKENVTILLFEELVSSPVSFFEKMTRFFGVDSVNSSVSFLPQRNTRPTKRTLLYYKLRGYFPNVSPSKFLPNLAIKWGRIFLNSGTSGRKRLLPEMEQRLMNMYRESNRKLQQELGIDLVRYGYIT